MSERHIEPLRYWVQKSIPAVYDDTLSYYELLSKVVHYLNEVIENSNELNNDFIELLKEFLSVEEWFEKTALPSSVSNILNVWLDDGRLAQVINDEVFNMKADKEDVESFKTDVTEELDTISTNLGVLEDGYNKKTGGIIDPREFGAVGDGVADDTQALQDWLNHSGTSCVLRDGVFRITDGLISDLANRTIQTEGATIIADGEDIVVLTINGENSRIHVNIDGCNNARIGVLVTVGGCEVTGCRIENIYGMYETSAGIRVESNLGAVVSNNYIKNVSASDNANFGDSMGSSRAIVITSTLPAMESNYINDNYIEGVTGEEGDGIQLLFYEGSSNTFYKAKGFILNNTIKNANRRAIKVQAHSVVVEGNKHINTLTVSQLPNANTVIDVINSHNVVIRDNDIDANHFIGIKIVSTLTEKTTRNIIENNRIISSTKHDSIYLSNCINSTIESNTIYDGFRGIAMTKCLNIVIDNNKFFGGDPDRPAINIVDDNNRIFVTNNTASGGTRLYLLDNRAPNCVVSNNHSRTGKGLIRTYATSTGSIYIGNSKESNSIDVISGDVTGQITENNYEVTTS